MRCAVWLTVCLFPAVFFSGVVRSAEPESAREAKSAASAVSAEEKIVTALGQPVSAEFIETPLADVADYFADILKVPVKIDRRALDDVGIGTDEPITVNLRGISARSILNIMLRQKDLTYVIRDEVLLITTPEEAESHLVTRVYDVADLVAALPVGGPVEGQPAGPAEPDFDSLIGVIGSCVAASTWDDVGGPGSVAPFQAVGIRALVVSQTQAVHEEVESLLKKLRAVRHGKPPVEFIEKPIGSVTPGEREAARGRFADHGDRRAAAEAKILKALDEPLRVEFKEVPLSDAVGFLRDTSKLPIVLERKPLDDAGIATDTPLTLQLKDAPLRTVLGAMLRPLGLAWMIHDEVLVITTPEDRDSRLSTRVYDVADLAAYRTAEGRTVPDFEALIDTITTTVAPTTWDNVGGPGSIKPFDSGGAQALVVSQTFATHEAVTDVLIKLRKARKPYTKGDLEKLPPPPPPPPPRAMGDPDPSRVF